MKFYYIGHHSGHMRICIGSSGCAMWDPLRSRRYWAKTLWNWRGCQRGCLPPSTRNISTRINGMIRIFWRLFAILNNHHTLVRNEG